MLCNWCHKIISVGEELKEQDAGYSYSSFYEGTGGDEGWYRGGGYYHRQCYLCYLHKQLSNLKRERDELWKGWFWPWIFLCPVLIIIVIMKFIRKNKLDKAIKRVRG